MANKHLFNFWTDFSPAELLVESYYAGVILGIAHPDVNEHSGFLPQNFGPKESGQKNNWKHYQLQRLHFSSL